MRSHGVVRVPASLLVAAGSALLIALSGCSAPVARPVGPITQVAAPTPSLTSDLPSTALSATPSPRASPDYASPARGAGCPRTSATTPARAVTARIGDIDGDGRADIEWAQDHTGTVTVGVTTASHATFSVTDVFAGGAARTAIVAEVAHQVIAVASEGRSGNLFAVVNCRFVATDTTTSGQRFILYGDPIEGGNFTRPVGTGISCSDDQLAATRVVNHTDSSEIVRSTLTVQNNGRTVTVGTPVVINRHPSAAATTRAYALSCDTTPVLHPTP